ncbi:MAG: LuxR C-terminal-related transcriptional regulator [Treponema sp.]|jgi:LuxR family maltose regulon positive regulatory protein|nr:LuxR C-terminal-related transcriptional regulator [Treponema sp.]
MQEDFFHSNAPIVPGNQPYLERPRIDRLLETALHYVIITVVAGAGYGKTQGVYAFLHKCKRPTVWLQLSEQDNQPSRFWEHFTQAVAFLDRASADKLREIGFPETEQQFDRYRIISRDYAAWDREYLFVYDDFHLLQKKKVLRFIERSISRPFSNSKSILISRTRPAIDIEDFASKGLVAHIDEDDLRFSQQEIIDYYRSQNIPVSPETASDMYHDTEGWAFAIHCAGVSLKNGGIGYARSSMQFNSFKFIEYAFFTALSPALQKYLIRVSLIDHWPLAILTELASDPGIIEELNQINSFISFDFYQNRYRIHHLFLKYLQEQQGILSAPEKQEVYAIAARWCLDNNLKMDAVTYYERTGNYQAVFDVCFSFPQVMPFNVAAFFMETLERAPPDIYDRYIDAFIIRTKLLISLNKFDETAAFLNTMKRIGESLPSSEFTLAVLYAYYVIRGFWELITCIYTKRYTFAWYFKRAHESFYGSLIQYEFKGSHIVCLGSHICMVSRPEKEVMEQYITEITQAVPHISAVMQGCAYGMDDLARAELAYFKNDLAQSECYALEAIRKAREKNQYPIENRALFYLLRIHLAQGNETGIQECLQQLQAQLLEKAFVDRHALYDMATGWLYTHMRQPHYVAAWLKNDFEEKDSYTFMHGLESLVKLKYQVSEQRYAAALAFLESQKHESGIWLFLFGRIAFRILEAVCLYHCKEKDASIRALEEAYQMAESNALDMLFIELGNEMRTLMTLALNDTTCVIPKEWLKKIRGHAATYAKKWFSLGKRYRNPLSVPEAPYRALSDREQKILLNLSQGLTREEIAQAANLSINTVKSVIKSVYTKLGALNRADAIRIATNRGMLKDIDPTSQGV